MYTTQIPVEDMLGAPLVETKGLIWGNNAAWMCVKCGRLHGNRTGDSEYKVQCRCGVRYEIKRGQNKNGHLDLGPALGVRAVNWLNGEVID